MRSILSSLLLIFLSSFSACNENSANKVHGYISPGEGDKLPIQIQGIREGDKVYLSIQPQSGFGIQIEAPNKLEVRPVGKLEILSQDLSFLGKPNREKPDYYSMIQPMTLTVRGEGNLHIEGKLFYCDYSKNICLPGKLNRQVQIP